MATDQEILDAVERYGSQTDAARHLGITKQAVSARLKKIMSGKPARVPRDRKEYLRAYYRRYAQANKEYLRCYHQCAYQRRKEEAQPMKEEITMAKENIGPRVEPKTKDFYAENFRSINSGAEYILESFPVLYRMTLAREIKGRFVRGELALMIDVMNGTFLTPGISGQHLIANCSDGIALDGLDEKWGIEKDSFLFKLRSVTLFQCHCLEVWARAFWESEKTGGFLKEPDAIEAWIAQLL